TTLEHRIATLLGGVPYRISYFADGAIDSPPYGDPLPYLTSEKTVLPVPAEAAAVLMLSACRFESPQRIATTYEVRHVGLAAVKDAAVRSLELPGNHAS